MRRLSVLLLFLGLTAPAAAEPVDDVKESFLTYKAAIIEADGEAAAEVVSYAVEHGWIGRNGASQLRLGDYRVDGDRASGTILRPDGMKSTFKMEFVKEGGRWLLDLVALMNLTRVAFEYAVQQSELSEDEFVLLMLEQGTGRKPGPEIWSPPQ